MSKLGQRIELAANILIIVAAILLIGAVGQKFFFNRPPEKMQPIIGARTDVLDETERIQSKTLILALQTTCHFCNESAPFYRRLIEAVKDKNVKLVAVLPTSIEESKAHLSELGLPSLEVRCSPLEKIRVSGTPTLILTNENGEITDYWVGKLSPDKETEVIDKLNS